MLDLNAFDLFTRINRLSVVTDVRGDIRRRELRLTAGQLWFEMNFSNDVRATLLYFDLFDHPLSRDELYRFHPANLTSAEFDKELSKVKLRSSNDLFHLRSDDELVELRRTRELRAKWMLFASRIVGSFIRYFPFVRAAFLSGSLSKGVDAGNADVDLFIISAEKRLWICRSIMTAFKKVFLLNSKRFLCPNYFLTEDHLEIPEKNIFTATELVTLKPLFNRAKLYDLLAANEWISQFYPNFKIIGMAKPKSRSPVQRLLELPLSDGYTERWDTNLMLYFNEVWEREYPEFDSSKRDFLFRTTPYSSKIHPNDFQTKVLSAYEERLRREKLERLIRIDD